ncbi:MAG: DUF1223 domain-containing protein, partial [Acidobacteriota bacterium]
MRTYGRTASGVAAAIVVGAIAVSAARQDPAPSTRNPSHAIVVAELFTSEGCSSCPAADDLLREWLASQPVPGVEIVGLGEHVDYWNRLGWRDPFSSAAFSARQSAYDAAVFRDHRIYTPQIVIDGRLEAIGSDASAVRRAVIDAARAPKASVAVSAAADSPERLQVRVRVQVPPAVVRHGTADVVLAITEDGLATRVGGGENGGRTLRHPAVARSLTTIGIVAADATERTVATAMPVSTTWAAS